jgi:hypothetical protein
VTLCCRTEKTDGYKAKKQNLSPFPGFNLVLYFIHKLEQHYSVVSLSNRKVSTEDDCRSGVKDIPHF